MLELVIPEFVLASHATSSCFFINNCGRHLSILHLNVIAYHFFLAYYCLPLCLPLFIFIYDYFSYLFDLVFSPLKLVINLISTLFCLYCIFVVSSMSWREGRKGKLKNKRESVLKLSHTIRVIKECHNSKPSSFHRFYLTIILLLVHHYHLLHHAYVCLSCIPIIITTTFSLQSHSSFPFLIHLKPILYIFSVISNEMKMKIMYA